MRYDMADEKKKEDKKKKGGEEEATPEVAPAPAAGGRSKMLIIVGGVVVLALAIGIPTLIFTMQGHEEQISAEGPEAESTQALLTDGAGVEDELEEGEEPLGAIFPLESFVVNLQGGGYLRTQVQLEFVERDVPRRLYVRLVPVRDAIIHLLSNRSQADLGDEKGRGNLKNDIKELVNEVLKKAEVRNVYFTQFVVQ